MPGINVTTRLSGSANQDKIRDKYGSFFCSQVFVDTHFQDESARINRHGVRKDFPDWGFSPPPPHGGGNSSYGERRAPAPFFQKLHASPAPQTRPSPTRGARGALPSKDIYGRTISLFILHGWASGRRRELISAPSRSSSPPDVKGGGAWLPAYQCPASDRLIKRR